MPHRNKIHRVFSLQVLENREVLSANLPVGADLIDNGDFEALDGSFAQDWTGAPAQVAVHDFQAVAERGNVAIVEAGGSVTQTVDVIAGQKYILAVDFRLAGGSTEGQLLINDGDKTVAATDRWQTAATSLIADSSQMSVLLEAVGGNVFIDCVRLIPVEDMLLENASFEEIPNDLDDRFSSRDFSGWNSVGDRDTANLTVRRGEGSDGNASLLVDGNSDFLDRVFQRIASTSGQKYFVSFDLKGSEAGNDQENELRVRWNDDFMGAFDGTGQWQTFGFVADATSDLSRLLFREVGSLENTGDGMGPLIDNVQIHRLVPGADSLGISDPGLQAIDFIEDQGPVGLFSDELALSNSVDDMLLGAVVKIQNVMDFNGMELLAVDTGATNIQSEYDADTGRLRLSGKATLEEYRNVLRTLTYENLSQDPDTTTRVIRVSIDYGVAVSQPLTVDVNVVAVNDRPTMLPIGAQSVTVLTSINIQVEATDAENPDDLVYSVTASGTALGPGDAAPTISDTGLIEWIPQQSGIADLTVTAEDPEGRVVRRTFTVTAVLDAEVPVNFSPFSGARQLSNVVPSLRNNVYNAAPSMNIDLAKEYRAIIQTDDGQIEILLYDNDTPITVNNFVNLARDGFYDGLTFQRVASLIFSPTDGFIAQGGDPLGTGGGGPGYQFADENLEASVFDKPVIAMANRGVGTSTNGGQFFLTYDDKVTHLNGNHTIFGEITGGMDVVNAITKRIPDSGIPAEVIRRVTILELDP